MLDKRKSFSKYLDDKNYSKSVYKTSNAFQLYNKSKLSENSKGKLIIHDELDPINENIYETYGDEFKPQVVNSKGDEVYITNNDDAPNMAGPSKWVEINEDNIEDHEDEVAAFNKAKAEYDIDNFDSSDDEEIGRKRKRHDTDDENSEDELKKSIHTEDELNELLPQQDEDGDIILETKPQPKRAGLISIGEVKASQIRHKNVFENVQKPKQGETIYRDKEGRIIKPGETKEDKEKKLKQLNEMQLQKWMKGVKQAEEMRRKKEEENKARFEPLARYELDKNVEDEIKQKERFGDPLKNLINLKAMKSKESNLPESFGAPSHEDRLMKNLDPNPGKKYVFKRKCKFKAPPNRYGIEAGYMWDGVDRGNGYEQRLLSSINLRNSQKNEYYKLRTEDM